MPTVEAREVAITIEPVTRQVSVSITAGVTAAQMNNSDEQVVTITTSTVDLAYRYNELDLSGTSAEHTITLTVPTSSPRSGRILLTVGGYNVVWAASAGTVAWIQEHDWASLNSGDELLVMWDYDGSRVILAATEVLT